MTADLFAASQAETPARPPCFMTLVARRKLGQGEDWLWCKSELIGKDVLLEGGIPPLFTRGKYAGTPNWKGVPLTKVIATRQEIDQQMVAYEAETGHCRNCAGSGQELAGWSAETGVRYRTCRRCDGSGVPAAGGAS